jgi:sulfur relay (sulfurtransferase) complex TusBCD TusD component (DsrE family)
VSRKTIAVHLTDGAPSEGTATAVQLAERLLARGHRVTVFAGQQAAALAAGQGPVPDAIAALLRRGAHGGTLHWVTDASAAADRGVSDALVPGVLPGDLADLWSFVRDADVVLSPGGGR